MCFAPQAPQQPGGGPAQGGLPGIDYPMNNWGSAVQAATQQQMLMNMLAGMFAPPEIKFPKPPKAKVMPVPDDARVSAEKKRSLARQAKGRTSTILSKSNKLQ